MSSTVLVNAENICKKLKESIDFVNNEIARLNGAKTTYEESITKIKEECIALGVSADDLDTVIAQGEERLAEICKDANAYIEKINDLKVAI